MCLILGLQPLILILFRYYIVQVSDDIPQGSRSDIWWTDICHWRYHLVQRVTQNLQAIKVRKFLNNYIELVWDQRHFNMYMYMYFSLVIVNLEIRQNQSITHCSCYFLKICIRGHNMFDCIVHWFKVIKLRVTCFIQSKYML